MVSPSLSSSPPDSTMATPRWLIALNKALSLPGNEYGFIFQLATLDAQSTPDVRSMGYRGAITNDDQPHRPVLLATTDVRTPKVMQFLSNPTVALAWWLIGSMDQFRITGRAYLVPAPEHALHARSNQPDHIALDWEAKRREIYDAAGPELRASWCRPTPGSVISSYQEAEKWPNTVRALNETEGLTEEEERNRQISFGNFALVLVEPVSVDWVQMGVQPHQRTRFTLKQDGWVEEILVP